MESSQGRATNRLSLPALISSKLTHPSVHHRNNDEISSNSTSLTSVKNDLGAWWNGRRATDTRPILPQLQSTSSISNNFSNSTHSIRPRANSAAATSYRPPSSAPFTNFVQSPINDDFAALPNARSHLTYRDDAYLDYPETPHFEQSRYPDTSLGGEVNGKEEESLRAAILASRMEGANFDNREEDELQRALAESSALARSKPPRADSTANDPEFQKAIAESRASFNQIGSSNPLETSEWKMRARNEKGRFFAEAGEHGWLPPGAGKVNEDEEEARMLELAIRISLEEARIREQENDTFTHVQSNSIIPPPLPRRPNDRSSSTVPPLPKRLLPLLPTVDLNSNGSSSEGSYSTSPPSSPTSPHLISNLSSKPTLAFIAPSRPRIFSFPTADGSPEERPYLSESFTTAKEHQSEYYSHGDGSVARSDSRGTFSTTRDKGSSSGGGGDYYTPESSTTFDSRRQSLDSNTSSHHSRDQNSTPLVLSSSSKVVNPALIRIPSTSTTDLHSPTDEENFSPFPRNSLTGRSMSLISEKTEPSNRSTTSVSGHDEPEASITEMDDHVSSAPSSASYKVGGNIERLNVGASQALLSRMAKEKEQGIYGGSRWSTDSSKNGEHDEILKNELQAQPLVESSEVSPIEDSEISPSTPSQGQFIENINSNPIDPPPVTNNSPSINPEEDQHQRVDFDDGVRFGLTAPCADEIDHSCSADGLSNHGPFPTRIVLSLKGENLRKFAIEAKTWTALLRLLMWYGDTTIEASDYDIEASEYRHCESSLSLEFRRNDEGIPIIRLTITLLLPEDSFTLHELRIVPSFSNFYPTDSNSKGKAKARLPSTIFELPDHQVLPSRLNSIAISLYTLRHLSNIAASTQASKDASASYLNLRTLGSCITDLAQEHSSHASDSNEQIQSEMKPKEEDRLVTRLKDRLRRLGGGGGTKASTSHKLTKAPPSANRTRNIEREERVLADDDEGSGVMVGNSDSRERVEVRENNTERDLRYLPELSSWKR